MNVNETEHVDEKLLAYRVVHLHTNIGEGFVNPHLYAL